MADKPTIMRPSRVPRRTELPAIGTRLKEGPVPSDESDGMIVDGFAENNVVFVDNDPYWGEDVQGRIDSYWWVYVDTERNDAGFWEITPEKVRQTLIDFSNLADSSYEISHTVHAADDDFPTYIFTLERGDAEGYAVYSDFSKRLNFYHGCGARYKVCPYTKVIGTELNSL